MNCLEAASRLASEGRFIDALLEFKQNEMSCREPNGLLLFRAELLEKTGCHDESRRALSQLEIRKDLTTRERSHCEYIQSRLSWEMGDTAAAIAHLQTSVVMAKRANEPARICLSQIRLLALIADRAGPESTVALLAEVRQNVIKLGDPHASAILHLTISEVDGKRGLLQNSLRHIKLANQILCVAPNVWLEAWAEVSSQALAIQRCAFEVALEHGLRGLALAEQSGVAHTKRACLGNLGNVYYAMGEYERAIAYIEEATKCLDSAGEFGSAGLETRARIRLSQGRLLESEKLLEDTDKSIQAPRDRNLYVYRHAQLTRARLFLRQCRFDEALDAARVASQLALEVGDKLLWTLAQLAAVEAAGGARKPAAAGGMLDGVVALLPQHPPDVFVQYERARACLLAVSGETAAAREHFERARRIAIGLRSRPAIDELEASWKNWTGELTPPQSISESSNILDDVAAALLLSDRPEVAASLLVSVLTATAPFVSASAIARSQNDQLQIIASGSRDDGDSSWPTNQFLAVGGADGRSVELLVQHDSDFLSTRAIGSVKLLLNAIAEIQSARAELGTHLTLWPVEEFVDDSEPSLIAGRMAELMTFARRVARTNVAVLITGESGTGKEILARAIHRYSARAQKPFVPLNCTAVPRDMLESHLFGHRRGAFTSADRDHPGLIRAAKDGTLFLDEVGELGLELQPKLLRFLESGEINPLGEPTPFTVDVRIIAATNSNLEQMVQDGRFREDLFYRLNVVRLTIPPLRERRDEIPGLVHHFTARAAAEFGKGRVRVAEDTMEFLLLHGWPGNIRQLQNELRRMVALAEPDATLTPSSLSDELRRLRRDAARADAGPHIAVPLTDKLAPTVLRLEREMIKAALRTHSGRVEAAARALGISRKGLYLKRQRLGL